MIARNKLIIDKSNPNVMSDKDYDALKEVIKKFGFIVPIITNKDFLIADGFHRFKAARDLNIDPVPIISLDVDEIDRRLLRQILNKLHGTHKEDLDQEEFKFLDDSGAITELMNYLPNERNVIKKIIDKINEGKTEPEEEFIEVSAYERAKKNTKIKNGDIFKLGNHRLMCGDSTVETQVNSLMDKQKANLLLTDPPYGIDIVGKGKTGVSGETGFKEGRESGVSMLAKAGKYQEVIGDDKEFDPTFLMQYGIHQIIFGANNFASKLKDNSQWLVWDKKANIGADHNNFSDAELAWTNVKAKSVKIYRHLWSGLLRTGERDVELKQRVHPTQKPVALMHDLIKDYSTENGTILDLFGGSGSTLIACEQLNRKCLMMEIDPVYTQVIIDRWEKYTGNKAEKALN